MLLPGSALEGGAVFEGEGQAAIRVSRGVVQQAAPELLAEGGDLAVLLLENPEEVLHRAAPVEDVAARRAALGDRYDEVQARVNEILGAAGTSSTPMDVDAMARAVIRGDYGNGEERKRRLGSYYDLVQSRVNEMLL